ncbi:hypothetical protein [Sphingobium lignivorans]|uniref:Uncharacterized protein n=1 Tax=Sphingobium lignivorans TaxID=2735886 RepID=A0ABR6NF79_9SPHN|nr:hypothetical protein [Sphingobium lignivorans]MBB5985930.1 hypothetical protein [Sphingobium lignivorans]
MSEAYVIAIEGFASDRPFETLPAAIKTAARRAVNRTADRARTDAARRMLQQVKLPPSYLQPSQGRLTVSKRASGDDMEAIVTGRQRPTSLARFARGNAPSKTGVSVEVAPGFARFMRRAFLIRLRAGSADLDTKSNLGLAIRLKPGERIESKRQMIRMKGNLYLLYGPSVDQLFNTIREDIAPDTQDFLSAEFLRLVELDGIQ